MHPDFKELFGAPLEVSSFGDFADAAWEQRVEEISDQAFGTTANFLSRDT